MADPIALCIFDVRGQVLLAQKADNLRLPAVTDGPQARAEAYAWACEHVGAPVEPQGEIKSPPAFVFMTTGALPQPTAARWVQPAQWDSLAKTAAAQSLLTLALQMLEHPTLDFVKARDRVETLTPNELQQCDVWLHAMAETESAVHSIVAQRMQELDLAHPAADDLPDELAQEYLPVPTFASLSQPAAANLQADSTQLALGQPFRFSMPQDRYAFQDENDLWRRWALPQLQKKQTIFAQPQFDGVRLQLHYADSGKSALFTAEGEDRWKLFPQLAALCARLGADSFIFDCVFVQWTPDSKPIPVAREQMTWMVSGDTLQIAPVVINVVDVLSWNGEQWAALPLAKRLANLHEIMPDRVTLLQKVQPRPFTEATLTFEPTHFWETKEQAAFSHGLAAAAREPSAAGAWLRASQSAYTDTSDSFVAYHANTALNLFIIGIQKAPGTPSNFKFRVAIKHNAKLIPLEVESGQPTAQGWQMCPDFAKQNLAYAESNIVAVDMPPRCGMILVARPQQFKPFKAADGLWSYTWVGPQAEKIQTGAVPTELDEALRMYGYQAGQYIDRPEQLVKAFLRKNDGAPAECPYCAAQVMLPSPGWNQCGWCKNTFLGDAAGETLRQDETPTAPNGTVPLCRVLTPGAQKLKKAQSFLDLTVIQMSALDTAAEGIMLALAVPKQTAEELLALVQGIPNATYLESDQLHLTLAYLGKAKKAWFDFRALQQFAQNFAELHGPLRGKIAGLGRFYGDGKEGALYATFDCPQLNNFQRELVAALREQWVTIDTAHGFTPHITLAYLPTTAAVLKKTPNISVTLNRLVCAFGGEWSKHQLQRQFLRKSADAWTTPPVEQAEGYKFVYQHHARGKSVHGDLRLEHRDALLGWTVFEEVPGVLMQPITDMEAAQQANRNPDLWRIDWQSGTIQPKSGSDRARGVLRAEPKKEAAGLDWLTREGIIPKAEPGEPIPAGATRNFPGVLTIVDQGTFEYGAQRDDLHEYFLSGGVLQGRWVFKQLKDMWVLLQPADERPYVLSNEAQMKKWLPPFGYSALPFALRDKTHPSMAYWNMSGAAALDARAALATQYAELSSPKMNTDAEGGIEKGFDRRVQVFKSDVMQQIVWGVVLEPDETDSQGHFITEPEIAEALHYFMLHWQLMDEEHSRVVPRSEAAPVEAFQAPIDMEWPVGNATVHIKKGSWVMATKIFSDRMWKDYLNGRISSYSIRGYGFLRTVSKAKRNGDLAKRVRAADRERSIA